MIPSKHTECPKCRGSGTLDSIWSLLLFWRKVGVCGYCNGCGHVLHPVFIKNAKEHKPQVYNE